MRRPSGLERHDLDLFSLVAGTVFLLVAVGHLLDVAGGVNLDGRWVAPVVLLGLGLAGLAGVLRRTPSEDRAEDEAAADARGLDQTV